MIGKVWICWSDFVWSGFALIFPNLSANIYKFYGNCISASGLESTLFSRQIYLDYVTYLRQKCKGHLTYLTIVGGESRPWPDWSYCTLSANSFVYKWAILFVQTGYPNSLYKRVSFHTFVCLNNDDNNNNNNKTGQVELSAITLRTLWWVQPVLL